MVYPSSNKTIDLSRNIWLISDAIHFVLVIPFAVFVLCVYLLPTLNISLRLLIHFLAYCVPYHRKIVKKAKVVLHLHILYYYYDLDYLLCKEKLERPESILMQFRLAQLLIILICMVTVLSFVLLAMECIIFFAEYILYTVIGIILNASFALKYVSVLFMVVIYARECFEGVTNKYSCFNSDIHDFVLGKVKQEIKEVAAQDEKDQKNTAFLLPSSSDPFKQENEYEEEPSTKNKKVCLFCCEGHDFSTDTYTSEKADEPGRVDLDHQHIKDATLHFCKQDQENLEICGLLTQENKSISTEKIPKGTNFPTVKAHGIKNTSKTLTESEELTQEENQISSVSEPFIPGEQTILDEKASLAKEDQEIEHTPEELTQTKSQVFENVTHEKQNKHEASDHLLQESQETNKAIYHPPDKTQESLKRPRPLQLALTVEEGVPKWKISHLIVFLDREDTSYLTQKFFFDIVNMPHSGGPGNLLSNILSAFTQFMVIILFLLFVILVVMIFGDEYKVSGFSQMIATLVTGFLPWVFMNILFKQKENLSVDTDNVNFQNSFEAVVRNYKQSWELSDLPVDEKEELSSSREEVDSFKSASNYVDEKYMKTKLTDETTEMTAKEPIKILTSCD
ncbi:hypothetical protein FSP39_025148 [Pinctada imbricata]|uniref:Uncharacterized protein n=1 Tax=Pinctada imbricata TaxID=66713 RepID=A0AA89C3C9_PINIB|nr:hypothetical protein FSP39_025148 [Pinctada imbricata]